MSFSFVRQCEGYFFYFNFYTLILWIIQLFLKIPREWGNISENRDHAFHVKSFTFDEQLCISPFPRTTWCSLNVSEVPLGQKNIALVGSITGPSKMVWQVFLVVVSEIPERCLETLFKVIFFLFNFYKCMLISILHSLK